MSLPPAPCIAFVGDRDRWLAALRSLASSVGVLVVATLWLASCSSLSDAFRSRLVSRPADVPAAIERAERELAEGETRLALRRARDARDVRGISPADRDRLDILIERIAAARIDELSQQRTGASELADMVDAGLPKQLSVTAGLRGARLQLDADKPFKAYRLLRKLEERFPRHHGRAEAGALLVEAGLKLADDPWSFLFFSARDDGVEILEYLVLTYPSERRCDVAFAKLAEIYEDQRLYGLAIQRHEELLFSHGDSPLAAASQARIPHLRLMWHESPDYDRSELLRAKRELESWLSRRQGEPEEEQVRLDYADCLQRLVRSDLGIARYYRRIDRPFGARYHAERALRIALDSGSESLVQNARRLLASIPEVTADSSAPLGDEMFSSDPALMRSTLEERSQPSGAPPSDESVRDRP